MIDVRQYDFNKIAQLPAKERVKIYRNIKEILRINARKDLRSFVQYTYKNYKWKHFNEYLCKRLEAFVRGEVKRLIIKMPPRHGKTELVSLRMPAFAFGVNPNLSIISSSYADSLASSNNRALQRIMDSDEYKELFPNTRMKRYGEFGVEKNSKRFDIVGYQGSYRSAGIGSGITGKGFDLGIIDDAIKDAEEAESLTIRNNIWDWYLSTFRTRPSPNAGICICGTQWNSDDLIGRAEKQNEGWEVIVFPMMIETEEDIYPYDNRKIGELLHPERYSYEDYVRLKESLGTYWFSALYQQRPVARDGNVIKRSWYPIIHSLDLNSIVKIVAYVDLGASDQPTADRTAVGVTAKLNNNRYVKLWLYAGRWTPAMRNKNVTNFLLAFQNALTLLNVNVPLNIYIENTFGLAKEEARRMQSEMTGTGLVVRTDDVRVSKGVRANAYLVSAENSFIDVYEGDMFAQYLQGYDRNWAEVFFKEATALIFKQTSSGIDFKGGHDDCVDVFVGGYNKLNESNVIKII